MKYVAVANRVNKVATAHLSSCSFLGANPELQSSSAERRSFDDGLDAMSFAHRARPDCWGLCGHCMTGLGWFRRF